MNTNNTYYGYGNGQQLPTTSQGNVGGQQPNQFYDWNVQNGYGYGGPAPLVPFYDPNFGAHMYMQGRFANNMMLMMPPPPPQQPQNLFDATPYSQVQQPQQQNVNHLHQAPQMSPQHLTMAPPSTNSQPVLPPIAPPAPVNSFLPTFPNLRATTPRITVHLKDRELWRLFHEKANEMHVKLDGKEIFPRLSFSVTGLEATSRYQWTLRLVRVCPFEKKWDSVEKCWRITEKQDTGRLESKEICSGIQTGEEWEKKGVHSFEKAQIHNRVSKKNEDKLSAERKKELEEKTAEKMNVNNFCTYQVVLSLNELIKDNGHVAVLQRGSFQFPETEFVVVTEYKNKDIRDLKTVHNNFNKKENRAKAQQRLDSSNLEQLGGSGLDSGYNTSSRDSTVSPQTMSTGASPSGATPFPSSQYFGADGSAPSTSSQY